MTNLTEQWRKGELRDGVYYIKTTQGFIITDYFADNWDFLQEEQVERILAKVPSYEEYEGLLSKLELQQTSYDFDTARLEEENTKLKERIYEFAEANQSLRKKLDEEKAKNRIDYYDGSPMDFLDECERARRKNKIFQNWIKNINKELLTSELIKTKEGNLFIVNLLKKIDQVLGEE